MLAFISIDTNHRVAGRGLKDLVEDAFHNTQLAVFEMRILVCAVFLWLLGSRTGAAQTPALGSPDDSQFTIQGVTIGQDNFTSLQAKLGSVKLCHTRRHVEIAGYRNANEEVIFEFGEVGGGDITGFYLRPKGRSRECPSSDLSADAHKLSTKGGVRLGMGEDDFARIFGPPKSRGPDGEWEYSWNWEQPLTDEQQKRAATSFPGADVSKGEVSITVKARFLNRALQYFYVSKLGVL
jgi:hypothetical protein